MDVLVIGDVHGCYHTFKKLIEAHWNPQRAFLVQVGDLIQKGPFSLRTFQYAKKLKKAYPYHTFFLKGNHEYLFQHYSASADRKYPIVAKTLKEFQTAGVDPQKLISWIDKLPLKWETPHMLITHAGIGKATENPFKESNPHGVLFNREPIKKMEQVQVYGHKYLDDGKPLFNIKTNSWNIDTAAWMGKALTGVLFDYQGNKKNIFTVPTSGEDLQED
jgi:serine/threonine protein phosphatase 1